MRTLILILLLLLSACGPRLVPDADGTFLDTTTGERCRPRPVRVGGEGKGQIEARCVPLSVPLVSVYHALPTCRGTGLALVSPLVTVVAETDGWRSWVLYGPGPGPVMPRALYSWDQAGVCDRAVPGPDLASVVPLSGRDLDEVPGV